MKRVTVLFFALLLFIACGEEKASVSDPGLFVPVNPDYIIKTNNLQELIEETESVSFIRDNDILGGEQIKNQLKVLSEKLRSGEILISFSREQDLTKYLLLGKSELVSETADSIKNKNSNEISINPKGFYTTISNGVFLASNSQPLLKSSLDSAGSFLDQNPNFTVARAATGNNRSSLFLNTTNKNWLSSFINYFPSTPKAIADWIVMELDFEENNVAFHGIATSGDSAKEVLNYFRNITPKINRAASITPSSAKGYYSFTYSNFGDLQENLNTTKDSLEVSEDHYLNFTEEAGVVNLNSGAVTFLRTNDPDLTAESFKFPLELVKEFRETTIYKNKGQSNVLKRFSPLLPDADIKFFAFLEEFLLFSEELEPLEKVISEYYNKATLANNPAYQKAVVNLAEASSLLVVNNNSDKKSLNASTDNEVFSINNYNFSAMQFVVEDKFAHLHGILYNTEGEMSTGIQQISSTNLIAGLGIPPYLIYNPNSKNPNIAVQDETNMLYQFSEKGDLISKKQLESRILGEIKQVDIHNNGNLQIAFATQNALHVIDRKGNNVAPFPILFKEPVSQPLAIFDYDNNNDYRFVITQGNNLVMYNAKGKEVKGFDFDKTGSAITAAPVHIRTQNKDYILVQEENEKLNILSRQGKSRVSVEEPINLSGSNWYLNDGQFTSISSRGELLKIDEQGKVTKRKLSTEGQPKIKANENLLVLLEENVLNINSKEIVLDFGLYTVPKIYQAGNKSFVSITDLQAKRVLIFDQEGNLLPGLPVYGNSAADILVLEKELFFAVQGEDNSVLLYKIPL